jgi:hypothetical protein
MTMARMYRRPDLRRLGLYLLMALAALFVEMHAGAQGGVAALSTAETLLFETDHLAGVQAPALLIYEFRRVSDVEPGFTDKVQLELASAKGKVSATLHFLSGKNKHDLPALDEAHGNPVLLGFLERDIAEMKRLTGGSTAYFRKRVRMALAESAQVSTQSITYQGKTLPAQAVRIQPYLDDPLHARFEPYVNKAYVFIVSQQVPGGVYQIRSSLENRKRQQPGTTVAGTKAGSALASDKHGKTQAVHASAVKEATASQPAVEATTLGQKAAQEPPMTVSAASASAPGAALPQIDETLTLVSVVRPERTRDPEAERKR